jgi:hypothetical protein
MDINGGWSEWIGQIFGLFFSERRTVIPGYFTPTLLTGGERVPVDGGHRVCQLGPA